MDIRTISFNPISTKSTFDRSNQVKINFGSKDVIDFSKGAKKISGLSADLTKLGFDENSARKIVVNNINTEEYKDLTLGYAEDGEIAHWVNIKRHLTPTEALLYQEYEMGDYYMQHADCGALPEFYTKSTIDAANHQIGSADFLPTDLAKYLSKGYDLALSGMILKGQLDEKTAQKVEKYYNLTRSENYLESQNVQQAEYTALTISQNLDKIENWTSDTKDKDGRLKSGLERPLTDEEATILVANDYMPQDCDAINNYIKFNQYFDYSLFDMSIKELWEQSADDIIKNHEAQQSSNITKLPQKPRRFESIKEAAEELNKRSHGEYSAFYEDIAQLDSKKFMKTLTVKQLKHDAMMSTIADRKLRQENIQALNSMSEELLDKIMTDENGKKRRFATLQILLTTQDLSNRIASMENYRISQPRLFNSMEREAVMDFLTNSDFHYNTRKSLDEFFAIARGKNPDDIRKEGEIISFSNFEHKS